MVGARGALSRSQAAAVLARLESKGGKTDLLARHLALEEEVAGRPLTVGNSATLLHDGPASYRAMFEALDRARDHINVEFYIIDNDETGRSFSDALLRKAAAGVSVNLMYDSVGCSDTPPGVLRPAALRRRQSAGIQPCQSAESAARLARQQSRPPQGGDRRRPRGVHRRHQHQRRVFERFIAGLRRTLPEIRKGLVAGFVVARGPRLPGGLCARRQSEDGRLARYERAHRRACRRAVAAAFHGHVGEAGRRAAPAASVVPRGEAARRAPRADRCQRSRRRDAGDLCLAALGGRACGKIGASHNGVFRARPADGSRAQGARRRAASM